MLNDKDGFALLDAYCRNEWSRENLQLYKAISQYKAIRDPSERRRQATHIYQTFIQAGSPLEANLHIKQRDAIRRSLFFRRLSHHAMQERPSPSRTNSGIDLLAASDAQPHQELSVNLFDEIEQAVQANLLDTMSRFAVRKEY
jgi:Regulator of G protein signaling domain